MLLHLLLHRSLFVSCVGKKGMRFFKLLCLPSGNFLKKVLSRAFFSLNVKGADKFSQTIVMSDSLRIETAPCSKNF